MACEEEAPPPLRPADDTGGMRLDVGLDETDEPTTGGSGGGSGGGGGCGATDPDRVYFHGTVRPLAEGEPVALEHGAFVDPEMPEAVCTGFSAETVPEWTVIDRNGRHLAVRGGQLRVFEADPFSYDLDEEIWIYPDNPDANDGRVESPCDELISFAVDPVDASLLFGCREPSDADPITCWRREDGTPIRGLCDGINVSRLFILSDGRVAYGPPDRDDLTIVDGFGHHIALPLPAEEGGVVRVRWVRALDDGAWVAVEIEGAEGVEPRRWRLNGMAWEDEGAFAAPIEGGRLLYPPAANIVLDGTGRLWRFANPPEGEGGNGYLFYSDLVAAGGESTIVWTSHLDEGFWFAPEVPPLSAAGAPAHAFTGVRSAAAPNPDPVAIPERTVVELAAGAAHTCARVQNGAVRCWGESVDGRLGYGLDAWVGPHPPYLDGEVSLGNTARQISAGLAHSCAVLDGGAVRCWGTGNGGVLGYGNAFPVGVDNTPEDAGDVDVGASVDRIAAGGAHTCALDDQGAVRCWGSGAATGYGNGAIIGDDEAPSAAGPVDLGGVAVDIVAGLLHTCALMDDDTVRCWGVNDNGQLGLPGEGNIGDDEVPSSAGAVVVGAVTLGIAAGDRHTCALIEGGDVRCWGLGDNGRLGYGNTDTVGDVLFPGAVAPVNLGGVALKIVAGGAHTCALLEGGAVRCWGLGDGGQLGYGNTSDVGDDEDPSDAGDVDLGGTAVDISAGGTHTCAALDDGTVRCWGNAAHTGYGAIMGTIGDDETPGSVFAPVPLITDENGRR